MKFDIEKFKRTRQNDEMQNILESLTKIAEESVSTLSEPMFVHNFLPLFLGEVPPNVDLLQKWFGIAGNPYSAVNIVGNDGEILYTVPAFFDRKAIHLDSTDETAAPITHIVKTTELLSNVHPKRAERYFEEQMNRRNMTKDHDPLTKKNMEMWVKICERYNKPLPAYMVNSSPVNSDVTTTDKQVGNTGLEYSDDIF